MKTMRNNLSCWAVPNKFEHVIYIQWYKDSSYSASCNGLMMVVNSTHIYDNFNFQQQTQYLQFIPGILFDTKIGIRMPNVFAFIAHWFLQYNKNITVNKLQKLSNFSLELKKYFLMISQGSDWY